MREYGSNINLPSLDNLFSSEQERQDAKLEKIQILPLTKLHPFRNHPFQVRDDDEMDKMVDSVKEYGVMTPAIVRPRKDGGYEIVAGHRRCHASQRAGVETMPCIVRDMDDDTAIILMVDTAVYFFYRKSKIWQAVNCPPQRYARRMNATGTNYLFGKGWKDNGRKDR